MFAHELAVLSDLCNCTQLSKHHANEYPSGEMCIESDYPLSVLGESSSTSTVSLFSRKRIRISRMQGLRPKLVRPGTTTFLSVMLFYLTALFNNCKTSEVPAEKTQSLGL